jgi:hypothetical protein
MDSEENIQQKIVKNAPEKAVVDVNEGRRRGLTERLDEEARTPLRSAECACVPRGTTHDYKLFIRGSDMRFAWPRNNRMCPRA